MMISIDESPNLYDITRGLIERSEVLRMLDDAHAGYVMIGSDIQLTDTLTQLVPVDTSDAFLIDELPYAIHYYEIDNLGNVTETTRELAML